jgi:hypothetical protein
MPNLTCYPPDQLGDALLRYPSWFASDSVSEPGTIIFYSYLTATRIECIENIGKRDIFTPLLSNRYESIQELAESQESDIVAETIDVPDVCLPS